MSGGKALLISYFFPPLADVGALRAGAFSAHLPESGWTPFVLTVKNPDPAESVVGGEPVPAGTEIHRAISICNPGRAAGKVNGALARLLRLFGRELKRPLIKDFLCLPDTYGGWIPHAIWKAARLVRLKKIDVVFVTCGPFSAGLIGVAVKFLCRKPLVLDFRDPAFPYYLRDLSHPRTPKFGVLKTLERFLVRHADRLVVTCADVAGLYAELYPAEAAKIRVVHNGYVEALFDGGPREPYDRFTVVYTGTFYANLTDPRPFFRALARLFETRPDLKGKVTFLYVGLEAEGASLRAIAGRCGVADAMRCIPRVSRKEAVDLLFKASLCLVKSVPFTITTKLYEALAAGAPVLFLGGEGEAARILRRYSNAPYYVAAPDDVEAIAAALSSSYDGWAAGRLSHAVNPEYMRSFAKRTLAGRLASVLDEAR